MEYNRSSSISLGLLARTTTLSRNIVASTIRYYCTVILAECIALFTQETHSLSFASRCAFQVQGLEYNLLNPLFYHSTIVPLRQLILYGSLVGRFNLVNQVIN